MKKLMSVLLALALVLAMVPVAASAAETTTGLPDAVNGVISLTEDVELSEVAVLTEGTTLKGNGHTISVADDVTWSDANGSQYMLLCFGDGITIEDVTVDAEGVAYGCVQFYASKEGTLTDVTLKNAQELGLLVNASQVTATGTLTLAGNGWGDVINVGWGSGIPAETEKSSFTVAEGAELVGVSSIYSDSSDVTNAGGTGTAEEKFEVNADGFTSDGEDSLNYTRPVASIDNEEYPSLQAAIDAAESGGTITLLDNITAEESTGGNGAAAFTIPAGVTLDGNGHTITASATWTDTNHPILGVTSGTQDVTTKIQNLTIEGNGKSGHGINVWNANNVAINAVEIYNCGTAGVVINNSTVTANGLQTSGSAWGAVNVDKGSAFTLTGTNELAENVQVYSEDAGEEDGDSKITVEGLKMVKSYNSGEGSVLKGFTYYTDDVSKLGEGYNEKTNTVYEDIGDAIEQATEGDTIVLTKNAGVETPITLDKSITIKGEENVTLTYKANKQQPEGTFITVTGANVTLRNITIDTNDNANHGVQFYETTGGKLDGVTIEGGAGTSVLINGSTEIEITDCILNPGENAYAHIEYGMGTGVTTVPTMSIDNVNGSGDAPLIYVDKDTMEAVKNNTEGLDDATSEEILEAINGKIEGADLTLAEDGTIEGEETPDPVIPGGGGGTPSEPEEPAWPFTDVTEGEDWFYDAVAYVYENGIMAGTDETTFEPTMELDRAMAAQLFYNLEGKPAVTGDSTFTDVTSGHWAVEAITWAAQNDIVAGIGGDLYDPDSNVTREQFAQMLYNYAKYKGYDLTATGDLTQFPDAGSISSWAETALSWANGNDLINGHENGTIDPKGSAIRAQAASIMANFDQNVAE